MQPYRVRFMLATPVALNHPWLHWDGILLHLMQLRLRGRDYYALPTKVPAPPPLEDELRRRLGLDGPIPRASISFFGPEARMSAQHYYKRFEERGFPAKRRIPVGSGHYRQHNLLWVLVSAAWCEFYGYGDIDLVEELLQLLPGLGNDVRVGWGAIASWSIEPLPEDRSLVCDGRAMRPIPVRFLAEWDDEVPLAWRAPYWAAEHVERCAPPGTRVRLREVPP